MAHKAIQRMLIVCLAAFVAIVSTSGQDYKALVGKWSMTSETNEDPVKWTLVIKDNGGKLTALLATEEGEQAAKDFTFADGVLKFKAPYHDEYYEIELKATGGKLDGTWSGGGDSGRTSGTKT